MGENKAAPVTVKFTESRLRNEKSDSVSARIYRHLDAGEVNLVLDFSSVEFVDSSFLGMLVVALKRATELGGDIVLCCLQNPVKTIFNLMRLHRIFGIYDTVDEALAAFDLTRPMARVLHKATVNCGSGALEALEKELGRFLAQRPDDLPLDATVLRLSVREGCSNALRHGADPAAGGSVTVAFLHQGGGEHPGLCVEITDPGPGVSVDGVPPPYPDSLAGFEFALRSVLDQRVVARVLSPWSIELRREDCDCGGSTAGRRELLQHLHGGGYGILLICRCWSRVSFALKPGTGNVLRLEGMRPDPGA